MKFSIIPEYRFKNIFSKILFIIGFVFILFSVLMNDGGAGIFLGIIISIIGLFYLIFTSKQYLSIDNKAIIFEKRHLVKIFTDEVETIRLKEIEDVFYLRRQIMIGNIFGTNPYADWEEQRIINPERIVIKIKGKKSKVIYKVGDKTKFRRAFELMKKSVSKH